MAIFNRDFYGLTKYGVNIANAASVEPFTAIATDYGILSISFRTPPTNNWVRGRMLRSKYGWACDQNDGVLVWDQPINNFTTKFTDSKLNPGDYYYYTLWVLDANNNWLKAGSTSGLVIGDTGMNGILWSRLPKYYRWIRPNGVSVTDAYNVAPVGTMYDPRMYDQENQTLKKFVSILGWGFDQVRSYQQTLRYLNDPRKIHMFDLQQLAGQMGIEWETEVPGYVMRAKVQNAGLLAKTRGTLVGLRNIAKLSTGWDVDVAVAPNMMLSRESSEFLNPQFPLWNSQTNYPVGSSVSYQGMIFTATVGAYGIATAPPNGGGSNTWWTQTTDKNVNTIMNPSATVAANGAAAGMVGATTTWNASSGTWVTTGGTTAVPQNFGWIRTWSVYDSTQFTFNGSGALQLSNGVSGALDNANQVYNALKMTNTGGSASYLTVLGTGGSPSNFDANGNPIVDPYYAISQGIPLPVPGDWNPAIQYKTGEIVRQGGQLWQCRGENIGLDPIARQDAWSQVGFDERPLLAYSYYTHSATSGGSTSGYMTVPQVYFYDRWGKPLAMPLGPEDIFYDTFNDGYYLFGTVMPTNVTATPSGSGGTLPAATYFYRVTAISGKGESVPSPEVTATTTGTTSSVALSWTASPYATSYRIYRGTAGGQESLFYTSATNSYTDTNANNSSPGSPSNYDKGNHFPDLGFNAPSNPFPAKIWNLDSGNMELWQDTPDLKAAYSNQTAHGVPNLMSVTYKQSEVLTAGQTTYNVAAQFIEDTGSTGMKDGLAVHIASSTSFWLFARDGIYQVSGGTVGSRLFAYPTPVKNFDRMRINLSATNGAVWNLYINEVWITSGAVSGVTLTIPSGLIHHGLAGVPA